MKVKNCGFFVLLLGAWLQTSAQFTSSNLPIVIIDTDGATEVTKTRIGADLKIVYNPGERNFASGPFNNYDGRIAIKGRGSSSWQLFDKKGYTLETQLPTGENNNVSILGLPAENDWVLHGPYADKTLMKNALVYDIGRELGRYTPRTQYCELVLNGEYRGVYLMVEKIKRDSNRLDIATLLPQEISGDDLTGGYIVRVDRADGEEWSSMVDFGFGLSYFNFFSPDPQLMPVEQKNYIRNYIWDFEDALLRRDDNPINGYRTYVDLASFVDYFIINELTKNLDAYRLSVYMYKDKDSNGGKLTMGPLWDYNLSCGGVDIGFGDWAATAENWVHTELPDGPLFWWQSLLNEGYYTSCLKERWQGLRDTLINEVEIHKIIDGYASLLDEAKDRNFEIFPLEEPVWGNHHFGFSYEQEIDTLKGFLRERIKWMDQAIASLPGTENCTEWKPELVTGLESVETDNRVYPNPSTGRINVKFLLQSPSKVTFEVYDLTGRNISTQSYLLSNGLHEISIDLSDTQPAGVLVYFLKTPSKTLLFGKLVME